MNNRIRELRGKYKMTQEDLANEVEVSRQTISAMENGNYNPSLLLAYKIARTFECTIEEVFLLGEDDQ